VEILRQIAAIAFVFSLLGAALWWLRRRSYAASPQPNTSRLQVIDLVRLTPHHSVHVLKAGDRELTIAVHPAGCTLLATKTPEKE